METILRLTGGFEPQDQCEADVIAEMRSAAEAARDGVLTGFAPNGGCFAPGKTPPPADALEREARLILSSMEVADAQAYPRLRHPGADAGRRGGRCEYHVRAQLALTADGPDAEARTLFTRDVTSDAVGFISPQRLPLGYGGTLTLDAPNGRRVTAAALLTRCRQSVRGWYEGALHFTRPQPDFSPEAGRDR